MRKDFLGLLSGTAIASCSLLAPAIAFGAEAIKIAVIAEAQAVAGSSIGPAAQLAADEINAKGGIDGRKIEIVVYDDHSSAAEAVRAFQRAVSEDKVNAVIASYTSEVVLALEPWAARLKTLMITPGAASDVITQNIAKDYEHNKYTFHGYPPGGVVDLRAAGQHRRHPARHVSGCQLLQRRATHGERVFNRRARRAGQRVGFAGRSVRGRLS